MSSDNPYAPPQAVVQDAPDVALPLPQPHAVTVAVWMLWIEVALSTLSSLIRMGSVRETIAVIAILFGAVLFQGLSALLILKIWQGRNWARITYLVLMLLGILSLIQMAATFPVGVQYVPGIEALLTFIGMTLDLVAMYLLFVPGRAWFRRR